MIEQVVAEQFICPRSFSAWVNRMETVLVVLVDALHLSVEMGCVSSHLSIAFDTILLRCLDTEVGVKGCALDWFKLFLIGRLRRVAVGDQFSSVWDLPCRVPHGTVLSFMLFNHYAKPLRKITHSFGACCDQYADDTHLYISISGSPSVAVQVPKRCPEG